MSMGDYLFSMLADSENNISDYLYLERMDMISFNGCTSKLIRFITKGYRAMG